MTTQTHKSILEQATNTNQNNKEGKRNKKHKKGNKDSNKSWRHSDSIIRDKEKRAERGGTHGFICSSLGKQRKRPGVNLVPVRGGAGLRGLLLVVA